MPTFENFPHFLDQPTYESQLLRAVPPRNLQACIDEPESVVLAWRIQQRAKNHGGLHLELPFRPLQLLRFSEELLVLSGLIQVGEEVGLTNVRLDRDGIVQPSQPLYDHGYFLDIREHPNDSARSPRLPIFIV